MSRQGFYNRYRDEGGDHISYVITNDLDDETAERLAQNYESTHLPVHEEKIREFEEKRTKETEDAMLRDDIQWLTGTGRYGQ